MDQPAVEFRHLLQQLRLFRLAEIRHAGDEKMLVFLLNMPGIEQHQFLQVEQQIVQGPGPFQKIVILGLDQRGGGLPAPGMILDELRQGLAVLRARSFLASSANRMSSSLPWWQRSA